MASLFESTFFARAVPAAERAFGVAVQFKRGVALSDEFTARRSLSTEYGLDVKASMWDWVLPVSALVLNSVSVSPVAGDQIVHGSLVYELRPADNGKLAAELLPGGYEYIAHSVELALISEAVILRGCESTDVGRITDAMVSLEEASVTRASGPVQRLGTLWLKSSYLARATRAQTATIRGEVWDVVSVGEVVNGSFFVSLSRRDADHTNTFDMNDQQAVWHQA